MLYELYDFRKTRDRLNEAVIDQINNYIGFLNHETSEGKAELETELTGKLHWLQAYLEKSKRRPSMQALADLICFVDSGYEHRDCALSGLLKRDDAEIRDLATKLRLVLHKFSTIQQAHDGQQSGGEVSRS